MSAIPLAQFDELVPEEPHSLAIHSLGTHGLERTGHHGQVEAMGVSQHKLPSWDDLHVLTAAADFRALVEEVREATGGIPIGVKLSAQQIEADLDAALDIGVDYVILDGRGGGTGAAPLLLRDNISVPTIPALERARRHLDRAGAHHVSLVITGGLRSPPSWIP